MKKVLPGLIITVFLVTCAAVVLVNLPKLQAGTVSVNMSAQSRAIIEADALKVQQAKDAVILQALAADKAEHYLREQKARQKVSTLPTQARFWQAVGALCAVSVFLFLGILAVGLAGGLVKIFWIHGDIVAGAFVRKALPDEYKLQTAIVKERIAQLKAMGYDTKALPEVIANESSPALFAAPNVKESLEIGLINAKPDFFLGTNTQTGENEFDNPLESCASMKVGGKQRKGKSNTLKNIAAQSLLKGWLNIWIDLHNPNKKSFVVSMGALSDLPQVKVFSDKNEATQALAFIDKLIDDRLHNNKRQPPVLIVVDEILNLVNVLKRQGIDASETFKRVVTEGGKNEIFMIAAAHTWTAAEVGSTGFRDGFDILFAHRMAALQAGTFGIKNKAAKEACDFLGVGQVMMLDASGEIKPVSVPLWDQEGIELVKTMINPIAWETQPIAEPEQEIKQREPGKVIDIFRKGW